jgi:bifunctional non-homologous end joining protein LigD
MPKFPLPSAAVPAGVPVEVRLQIVSHCAQPPAGDGWLHEIKHDGHRLVAIVTERGALKLLSRNGLDRTRLFRDPFRALAAARHPIVIDGEIAVPDERGVTHLDALTDALSARRPERLAYFAFDLLYYDGHDLRRCPIEHRKAVLREILAETAGDRVVYVDHVLGRGAELFEKIREIGAEGIVSKRLGRPYRGGESRGWLKTKCFETGVFAITGFQELGEGRLEAIYVAEESEGRLRPVGQVRFGFAGKRLWDKLDRLRAGPVSKGFVPVRLGMHAEIKYFGRHKGGAVRDGVILSLRAAAPVALGQQEWCCDCDEVIAAFDRDDLTTRCGRARKSAWAMIGNATASPADPS